MSSAVAGEPPDPNPRAPLYRAGQLGRPPMSSALNRLLTQLRSQVPGVEHALIVSVEGRPLATTSAMTNQDIERLSSITTGLRNLSAATSRFFAGGPLAQSTLEMRDRALVMTGVPGGACLAALVHPSCHIGALQYQMAVLADQAAQILAPSPGRRARRPPAEPAAGGC